MKFGLVHQCTYYIEITALLLQLATFKSYLKQWLKENQACEHLYCLGAIAIVVVFRTCYYKF